jgi:hypothetical protein
MSYTKVWEGGKMYNNECECNGFGSEMRRFLTKEEKVEILKAYKEGLQKEVKAVEERIKELGKNN